MNIVLISSEFGESGGGLSFACTRFKSLLEEEFNHTVTVIDPNENCIKTAKGGYMPNLEFKISNEYRIKAHCILLQELNIDLVIGFGGGFNGYYSSLIARRLHIRFILLLRGSDINLAKWDNQEKHYIDYSVKTASRVVCLSQEMKENIDLLCPSQMDKIYVIPNTISSLLSEVRFPNLPDKVILGTGATHINEKKGVANLINMIVEFKKRTHIPICLEIIGAVDNDLKDYYDDMVKSLSISDSVHFLGYCNRKDYHNITKTWDFYIQGSVCEGFGNSVSEAIQMGKGILLTPTGYIAECLRGDYQLFVFKDWNPENMANTLSDLIDCPQKEEMYSKAYKSLLRSTNKNRVIALWDAIINNHQAELVIRNPGILTVVLHEVDGNIHDHITTPTEVFERFVSDLHLNGFGLCSMEKYINMSETYRRRWIVCTFDDGYASIMSNVSPILKKYGFTATVFVNTSMLGKNNSWNWKDSKVRDHLTEKDIMSLRNDGWEIGSHGNTHRNLLSLTERELEDEFSLSKKVLEKIVGTVNTYAYPYGDSSPYTRKICQRFYNFAFSLHEGGTELSVDGMHIKRYSIDEIYKILNI